MSSSFFKEFYFLILFILLFSIIVIILFIPIFASDSNYSFTYNKPNISSTYSNVESIQMNKNSGFVWPTPRIYNTFFEIWKKNCSYCRCIFFSLWHRYCSSCSELILFRFYLEKWFWHSLMVQADVQ